MSRSPATACSAEALRGRNRVYFDLHVALVDHEEGVAELALDDDLLEVVVAVFAEAERDALERRDRKRREERQIATPTSSVLIDLRERAQQRWAQKPAS